MEAYNQAQYEAIGIADRFVQDNISQSKFGILRGLHFQNPNAQSKLVTVLQGQVFDVAVDLRRSSPTYRQWQSVVLSGENKLQFYIPAGFAHGFAVVSESALFQYKCTGYYSPETENTVLWSDPDLNISWPIVDPVLSEKDKTALRLVELLPGKIFG